MPALISNAHEKDAFHDMVDALREKLGPSSGISCDDVDPQELLDIMKSYDSEEPEWQKYVHIQSGTHYTRNLVDNCNGKSNLLILVWAPGKGSPIHDHANAHCVMRILKGQLKETLYHWPTIQLNNKEERPLEIKKETIFNAGEVTYMSDKLGLHEITNMDPDDYAISLHLYTPPNAAVYGCHKFVPETGKAIHVKGTVYSEYGQKLQP